MTIMMTQWLCKDGNEVSPEVLLETYKQYREEKNLRYEMMMNETKFYVTIISALLSLTVTGGVILLKEKLYDASFGGVFVVFIFLIIPIISSYLSYTGIIHLKGSYIVYLEHISVIIKLENIMGIDSQLKPSKCQEFVSEYIHPLFENDKYLIPNRWMERRLKINNTDDFVNDVINQPRSYYKNMRNVYLLFMILSSIIFMSGVYVLLIIPPKTTNIMPPILDWLWKFWTIK